MQAGGRKQRQRAASATNALLEHAPNLAGVVPIFKKLTRSILRFISRYNFNSFCQIHTISNFYTHFHQDRRQFFIPSSISIVYLKSQ